MNSINPANVSFVGLAGAGTIAFEGDIAHGNGRRRVQLQVEPATILRLAAELLTAGFERNPAGFICWHTGHAAWHAARNSDTPCDQCVPVSGAESAARFMREIAKGA